MKNLLISLVVVVFFSSCLSYADVIVITDKAGAIYSVSEKDDTIVPDGYTKAVVKGKLSEIVPSTRPIDEYAFDGKKFKVDAKVVKAKEGKQLEREQKIEAKKAKKQSAKDKLKALGLDDEEADIVTGRE